MFSENLKTIRTQRGMSQEILAQQLGVVRQTISKWEKGLSVPDAEMITHISDLFEVPVSELLGSKIEKETDINEVATQLAILNEQLANKSKRNKKIGKILLIVFLTLIGLQVFYFFLACIFRSMPPREDKSDWKTTCLTCTLNGEEYLYDVTYNNQYDVKTAGGDVFIADHVNVEQYSDANILMAQIENYFWKLGGTVEREEIDYVDPSELEQ